MVVLYELSGKDDARFSPFCWRARFALAHKGLAATTVPVTFTNKQPIAFSGQARVPVLVDGTTTVSESWQIACYLEDAYPDRPSLFGGDAGRRLTRFTDLWATRSLFPLLVRLVLCDVLDCLDPADATYVRESRERELGIPWDTLRAERDAHHPAFRHGLAPLRQQLRETPFLAGSRPAYADYSVFGFFQWARLISRYRVLEAGDAVQDWCGRMLQEATPF